jgi:flagellin-specific chaperone FliS
MIGARQTRTGPSAYRTIDGLGARPEEMMKIALDAVRGLLLRAEAALAARDRPAKAKALASASDVVEFMLGLSGFDQGTLSECLANIYHYVQAAILKGNATDDAEAVAAARIAIEELSSTWRAIFPDPAVCNDLMTGVGPHGSTAHA